MPYRLRGDAVEVLISHPGGPYWASKDIGAWSVVKGIGEPGEEDQDAARREFTEETGWEVPDGDWIPLGETVLKSGKEVVAWALEADFDPETIDPGTFEMEIKGRVVTFPEVDRVGWFDVVSAVERLNDAQGVFVERLLKFLTTASQVSSEVKP